jgi:sigma-B regulation protein RsbU (phosphoserine phosphatase)
MQAPPVTAPDGSVSAPARPESIRILLIEDNPGDARLIQLMLREEAGDLFEVEWVDRLGVAFKRLVESDFNLVLADLSLPDSQGLETFLRLHEHAPQLPIIVLSGLRDTAMAVQAVHEGAQDFLIKGQADGQLLVRAMRYAIERKRLTEQLAGYAQELRSKNAQLEADFNMAREIQQVFLPHQYPVIPKGASPEGAALRFYHRYLPAAAVGGDFFDVFQISDTAAGIFICDVMGHGMRAALITAIMRGLVEELVPVAHDASRFLTEINRSLHAILRRTREPFMATAFYMIADTGTAQIQYASAGHPSPIRIQRGGGIVESLKHWDARHGPALGLFDKAAYPACRCPMLPEDLFLLFTDGIYEADNAEEQEYGQGRLLASLRRHQRLPTERLLDTLVQDVRRFAGTPDFEDDVCLVAMDVR